MSDKMRAEFERTNGRDHRRVPPKGNNYSDPMAQADWESFQKGWEQSRASIVATPCCERFPDCVCGLGADGL